MRSSFLILAIFILAACSSTNKNQNAGQIPAAMECPASQDPAQGCSKPSDAAITLGSKAGDQSSNLQSGEGGAGKRGLRTIAGRCELWVEGRTEPQPCSEVKLQIRSEVHGELRDGKVNGFAVQFTDLNENSYKLIATSTVYHLRTDSNELEAGSTVAIRIKAKPRTR